MYNLKSKNIVLFENKNNNSEIMINRRGIFLMCYDLGDSLCEMYKLNIKLEWIEVDVIDVYGEEDE